MSKFMIEYADYQRLIELAKQNTSSTNELNTIINKYSVSKLINEIKIQLFNDVKKHKQGTEENKKAYDKYNTFKHFSDNLKEHINDNDISLDTLIMAINEQKIAVECMGIQVLT